MLAARIKNGIAVRAKLLMLLKKIDGIDARDTILKKMIKLKLEIISEKATGTLRIRQITKEATKAKTTGTFTLRPPFLRRVPEYAE